MRKIILPVIGLLCASILYGVYIFLKAPGDIRDSAPDVSITAIELGDAYSDEVSGNEKFLGKIVEVYGEVVTTELNGKMWTVYLKTNDPLTSISCSFYDDEKPPAALKAGDTVVIKGECTGKLSDVVLIHCSVTE